MSAFTNWRPCLGRFSLRQKCCHETHGFSRQSFRGFSAQRGGQVESGARLARGGWPHRAFGVAHHARAARGDALPPDLGACARSAVRQCEQALGGLARQACLQAQVYADRASACVVKQPIKSMAVAAAAGAVLALLLSGRRR